MYKAAESEHQKAANSNEFHKQMAVTDFLLAWRMNETGTITKAKSCLWR
jgi:hypothetical protein